MFLKAQRAGIERMSSDAERHTLLYMVILSEWAISFFGFSSTPKCDERVFRTSRPRKEMENAVSLQPRSKKHGEPDKNAELRAMMDELRRHEINRRRPGRNYGFEAQDDFVKGHDILHNGKILNFIKRTTAHLEIVGNVGDR